MVLGVPTLKTNPESVKKMEFMPKLKLESDMLRLLTGREVKSTEEKQDRKSVV